MVVTETLKGQRGGKVSEKEAGGMERRNTISVSVQLTTTSRQITFGASCLSLNAIMTRHTKTLRTSDTTTAVLERYGVPVPQHKSGRI
jgi:hypothetical protein